MDDEADNGEFVATNESTIFDRDAPAVNQKAMTLVMYTKKVDLTYQLLQGEDSGLMSFLALCGGRDGGDAEQVAGDEGVVGGHGWVDAGCADGDWRCRGAGVAVQAAGALCGWAGCGVVDAACDGGVSARLRDDKHFAFNPVWDAARGRATMGRGCGRVCLCTVTTTWEPCRRAASRC